MINAAERLSKRVRAAMGDHNNDDLPVTQCVINMRKEVVSLQAECEKLVEALEDIGASWHRAGTGLEKYLQARAINAIAAHRKQGGGTCS